MAQDNGEWMDQATLEFMQGYTLMNDMFMQVCFRGYTEGAETVLRVIMEKPDLKVTNVSTQMKLTNPFGRSLCLDIVAVDGEGQAYNIEIQRGTDGASPERARLHSSMVDVWVSRPGMPFEKLPQTWVIFITETDVLDGKKPLYKISRHIEWEQDGEKCRPFDDGSHIVYVNGAMREGETALAKLMHDFFCADPDEMYYPALAERVRYFKKVPEGIREMYSEIERLTNLGEQRGLERGRQEGRQEGRFEEQRAGAERMIAGGKLSLEDIADYSRLSLDQVRAMAAEQGKG